MGQKSDPIILRLEKTNQHFSFCWYGDYNYTSQLMEDYKVNKYIENCSQQREWGFPVLFSHRSRGLIKIAFISPRQQRLPFALRGLNSKIYRSAAAREDWTFFPRSPKEHQDWFSKMFFCYKKKSGCPSREDQVYSPRLRSQEQEKFFLNAGKNRQLSEKRFLSGVRPKVTPETQPRRGEAQVERNPVALASTAYAALKESRAKILQYFLNTLFLTTTGGYIFHPCPGSSEASGLMREKKNFVRNKRSDGEQAQETVSLGTPLPCGLGTHVNRLSSTVKKRNLIANALNNIYNSSTLELLYPAASYPQRGGQGKKGKNSAALEEITGPSSRERSSYTSYEGVGGAGQPEKRIDSAAYTTRRFPATFRRNALGDRSKQPLRFAGAVAARAAQEQQRSNGVANRSSEAWPRGRVEGWGAIAAANSYTAPSTLTPMQDYVESVLTSQLRYRCKCYLFKCPSLHQNALFIAWRVVSSLQERIPFRRIKERLIEEISKNTYVMGARISCSGRVATRSKKAQKARTESIQWGETSLNVFSRWVQFASKSASTPFGKIGVKVWICYKDR